MTLQHFWGFEKPTSQRIRHCFRKYFWVSITGLEEMFDETKKELKNLARLSLEPILRRSHILLRILMKLQGMLFRVKNGIRAPRFTVMDKTYG
jgi:hypothetical protein